MISFWQGTLTLTPASDNWVAENRMRAKTIDTIGNYSQIMSEAEEKYGVDPKTGFVQVWNQEIGPVRLRSGNKLDQHHLQEHSVVVDGLMVDLADLLLG